MGSSTGSWRSALVATAVAAAIIVQPSASADVASQESLMVSLVNRHRTDVGLGALAPYEGLRDLARLQSERMASLGDIFHNPDLFTEVSRHAPGWSLVGENVGMGAGAEHVQALFVRSPNHRANIEGAEWTHLAVGAAEGTDGLTYFTQIFVRFAPVRTAATMQEAVPVQPRAPRPEPRPAPLIAPEPTEVEEVQAVLEIAEIPAPTPAPGPRQAAGREPVTGEGDDGMADVVFRFLVRIGVVSGPK